MATDDFAAPLSHETGVLPPADVFAMAGLDFMRGIRDRVYPLPPIALLLRMRVIEAEPGHLVFISSPDESLMNPIGTIHGGYAMALLDSCMGCAVHTTCAPGEAYTTAEAKSNIVRPILAKTGTIRAVGEVLHRGRSLATAEGKLWSPDGKLLAHGTTTCAIMPFSG